MDLANADFTIGWYILLLFVLLSIPFAIRIVRKHFTVVQEEFEDAAEEAEDGTEEAEVLEEEEAEVLEEEAEAEVLEEEPNREAGTVRPQDTDMDRDRIYDDDEATSPDIDHLRGVSVEFDDMGHVVLQNAIGRSRVYELERALINDVHQAPTLNAQASDARRFVVKLPLRSVYKKVLHIAYQKVRQVFDMLSDDPLVVDMSMVLVFPFADCDTWHSTVRSELGPSQRVLSFGIALDDFSENEGAYEVLSASHLAGKNKAYEGQSVECDNTPLEHMCRYMSNVKGTTPVRQTTGSMLVWDNALYLRGGANASGRLRRMLRFTLMYNLDEVPDGADLSLNSTKHSKIPLSAF